MGGLSCCGVFSRRLSDHSSVGVPVLWVYEELGLNHMSATEALTSTVLFPLLKKENTTTYCQDGFNKSTWKHLGEPVDDSSVRSCQLSCLGWGREDGESWPRQSPLLRTVLDTGPLSRKSSSWESPAGPSDSPAIWPYLLFYKCFPCGKYRKIF